MIALSGKEAAMRPTAIDACSRSSGSAKPAIALHAMLAAALAALATSSAAAREAAQFSFTTANGQIAIRSWSWGPRQTTSTDGSHAKLQPGGGGAAGQKDMVMKGSTIGQNAPHGRWIPITQRPGLATGDLDDDGSAEATAAHDVKSPRDAASGMPTGKRQHGPAKIVKQYEAGRLTIHSNLPGCTVGTAYPDAVLQTTAARYELKDVVISNCAGDAVGVDYAKVVVRGWNPEKKEE
jgi:hypothetical protein